MLFFSGEVEDSIYLVRIVQYILFLFDEAYFKDNLELTDKSLAGHVHLLRVNKVDIDIDHHTPLDQVNIIINYDNRK